MQRSNVTKKEGCENEGRHSGYMISMHGSGREEHDTHGEREGERGRGETLVIFLL